MRFLLALLTILSAALTHAADDPGPAFRDALTAYKAGDYDKAIAGFKKVAEDGKQISAALCHDIANCAWKLDEKAAASIWYRRALALDHWLPEARQNLRFLENKLAFLRFEKRGLVKFAGLFPRTWWKGACQGAAWFTVITIVWLVWVTPRRGRRWPLVTLLCLSIALVITTVCGLIGKRMDPAPFTKLLISLPAENAWARTAPAEAAQTVIELPPGSELMPIREEGFWTYCDLPGGEKGAPLRGWVRNDTTALLWPYKTERPGVTEELGPWEPSLVE